MFKDYDSYDIISLMVKLLDFNEDHLVQKIITKVYAQNVRNFDTLFERIMNANHSLLLKVFLFSAPVDFKWASTSLTKCYPDDKFGTIYYKKLLIISIELSLISIMKCLVYFFRLPNSPGDILC